MTNKLTLNVKSEFIEYAKKYAQREGISLSSLVENYFKVLSTRLKRTKSALPNGEEKHKVDDLPDVIKRLTGIIPDEGKTSKAYYKEYMEAQFQKHSKHLRKK